MNWLGWGKKDNKGSAPEPKEEAEAPAQHQSAKHAAHHVPDPSPPRYDREEEEPAYSPPNL